MTQLNKNKSFATFLEQPSATQGTAPGLIRARARLRLICFPHAGGSASIFNDWRELLSPSIEIAQVELPGHGTRLVEPPFTHFGTLIQTVLQEIQPFLDLPAVFFGHSMGGLIAFELANELRKMWLPGPLHVFVSACRPPQLQNTETQIHDLPEGQFLRELRRRYGAMGGLLEHPELLEVFVPLLRADFSVCESYVYRSRPPLDCPISVFGGSADTRPNADQLAAWEVHTRDRFQLRIFPGDHFFLHSARRLLLQAINQHLRQLLHRDRASVRPGFRPPVVHHNRQRSVSVGKMDPHLHDPVFILSLPRSFSSVVCTMLGQHPQMYALPETNLAAAPTLGEWWTHSHLGLEHPRHGLLRAIAEIYFGAQTEATVQRAAGWIRRRAHFSTGYLLELIAERLRPRILVEKSPNIVRRAGFMRRVYSMFPNARFIHLVRHPGGHGNSIVNLYHRRKAHGPMLPSHWLNALVTESLGSCERPPGLPLDPQRAWYVLNARICEFLTSVPREQQLRVRGEDVLSHPDRTLRHITGWLGLRTDMQAIEAMKHPERSPYASFGPAGARFGNDVLFLKNPILRPARVEPQSLEAPVGWLAGGQGFLPEVRELAKQFGYEQSAPAISAREVVEGANR